MEDFEYLNEILDSMIDKNLSYRKYNSRYGDEILEKSIPLSVIERYNFEAEELEYIMNCLKEKEIYVLGSSPALYTVFDNYRYVVKNGVPRKSTKLNKEEQFNLLRKHQKMCDITDRNRVVESYISLVNSIALKYVDITGIDQDELASYGYEGLIVSIENLDLSQKFTSSYFYNTIHGYILNGIAKEQGFSSNDRFYLSYVKARKKVLEKHEFEDISEYDVLDEILEEVLRNRKDNLPSKERSKNKFYSVYATSIDNLDIIEKENKVNEVIEKKFQQELKKIVRDSLEILSPIQRQTITLRYGLDNGNPLTLGEVAKRVNISNNGVDHAIKRGMGRIRKKESLLRVLEEFNNENNHEYEDSRGVSYEKKRRA